MGSQLEIELSYPSDTLQTKRWVLFIKLGSRNPDPDPDPYLTLAPKLDHKPIPDSRLSLTCNPDVIKDGSLSLSEFLEHPEYLNQFIGDSHSFPEEL